MGEITNSANSAFRDYETDGVSASGVHRPVKSEIRNVFGLIDTEITDQDADIAALGTKVDGIAASQVSGALGFSTKADLLAVTGATTGQLASVFSDTTAANNGLYAWSGSAWVYQGADRIGKVEAATGAPLDMFKAPLIHDPKGIYSSGTETLYVPRLVYARIGSSVLNGTYGTASSVFSGYVALEVSSSGLSVAYLDLDDTTAPQKLTNWSTLPPTTRPDKVKVIAEVYNFRIKTPYPIIRLEDPDQEHLSFRSPIAIDGGKVLVPAFYHYSFDDGFTLYSPTDGSAYWELDLCTSQSSEWRYYFDKVAAVAGSTPIKLANSGATRPLTPANRSVIIEFGRSNNRGFITDHPVIGGAPGGIVSNLLVAGNDPDRAQPYDASVVSVVDVTEANLVALGFTRGFGGTRPMPRCLLPQGTPRSGWIFARVYVQASADNTFGSPTIYVQDNLAVNLVTLATKLEKKLSARAAIYSLLAYYSVSGDPASAVIGLTQAGDAANPLVLTGHQIYVGAVGPGWIARGDYGRGIDADILLPPKHYTVAGRPLPWFRQGLVPDRSYGEQRISLFEEGDQLSGAAPISQEIGDGTIIDYEAAGTSTGVMLSGLRGDPGGRAYGTLRIARATGSMSGTFDVLCFGDSITNRELPLRVKTKLTEMGFTPTMVGTMKNDGGEYGEGRGGWEYADFDGQDTQHPAVAIGSEADYLALPAANADDPGRWANNPFLRPSTSGDDSSHVFNGLIFDFPTYLSRFGVATPKYVPVLLGTNDETGTAPSVSLARIQTGLEIILPSILASGAYVGVGISTLPRMGVNDSRWEAARVPLVRAIMAYVAAQANPKLDVLPAWAHMSADFGWTIETRQTYAGRKVGSVRDNLHPVGINRSYLAECVAQWIACKEAGL